MNRFLFLLLMLLLFFNFAERTNLQIPFKYQQRSIPCENGQGGINHPDKNDLSHPGAVISSQLLNPVRNGNHAARFYVL